MIKCKVEIKKILYPQKKKSVSGEYAIFTASIIEHKYGETPVVHDYYKTITLKGVVSISCGQVLDVIFNEPEASSYGVSYKVLSVTKEFNPQNRDEVEEYLKLVCGERITKELMKLEDPYELLKNRNNSELLKVKGIGIARLNQIYSRMDDMKNYSLAYVKLEPLGLTRNQIDAICKAYGGAEGAVEVCMNRPYDMVGVINHMGFKTVDTVALKCGFDEMNPERIKKAITSSLKTLGESGKSYLYPSQLIDEVNKKIVLDFNTIKKFVEEMVEAKELILSNDGMMVALPYYVELEKDIAKEVIRIRDAKSIIEIPDNWMETVNKIEKKQGWNHTDEQLNGIRMVLENNITIVSGKAGSGKSTVTNAMSEILKHYTISLCCLSAKASQRLREVTGMDASTIHKLLNLSKNGTGEQGLLADIVIVDEASMINGTLFLKLLKSIRSGCKVIILGDDGQLTSIGNCAVFSDLIECKKVPHIELTKIHRQAEKSAIITKSIDFRNQVPICKKDFAGHAILGELQDLELFVLDSDMLLDTVKRKFLNDLEAVGGNVLEVQVVTAMKNRGNLSVNNINCEIQSIVNKKDGAFFEGAGGVRIYVGDKVINSKNNYDIHTIDKKTTGIWNGSIGIVESINNEGVTIKFVGIGSVVLTKQSLSNINLAYAITTHNSQGSQWKRVICAFDMSAYVLLNVEIIYTAITRASKHCSLIIERNALDHSARTVEQKTKQTLLSMFVGGFL